MKTELNMNNKEQKYKQIVSLCVGEIIKNKKSDRPLLVVMTGDSGSGKSYYSELIRSELQNQGEGFTYINADDFLISRQDREPMKSEFYESGEFEGKSKWDILENMFRIDEFRRVINELKQGKSVEYRPYKRETGTVSEEMVQVQPQAIIIFDSSMLLELMDYTIMVDVDLETIIERKVERDADIRTPDQVEEMHRKVQGYYWERQKPKKPDIIIDNNDFDQPDIRLN